MVVRGQKPEREGVDRFWGVVVNALARARRKDLLLCLLWEGLDAQR